jgi:hypothetical protein
MQQTSTPVANGSRVPVWPAFFAFKILLTCATTWADVTSGGLSKTMIPFIGALCLESFIINKSTEE